MSETDVVREAMKQLPYLLPGCKAIRVNSGRKGGVRMSSENMVDIIGVQKFGMFLAVEVKTEEGRLSDEQFAFLADIHRRGGYAGLFAPSGLYHFKQIPPRFMTPAQQERQNKR